MKKSNNAWQEMMFNENQIKYETATSICLGFPRSSKRAKQTFWVSKKLIRPCANLKCLFLVIAKPEFTFRVYKNRKHLEDMTFMQLKENFEGPKEELIDEDGEEMSSFEVHHTTGYGPGYVYIQKHTPKPLTPVKAEVNESLIR